MFYPRLEGPAREAYDRMIKDLMKKATRTIPEKMLVTRAIRATDVGLSNPQWTFNLTSTATWNTLIDNALIEDNTFVGICGVFYPMVTAQAVTELKIKRGGADVAYWDIQGVNHLEDARIYVDDPIIIEQNTRLTVQGYTISASTEAITLIGTVVQRRGILVSP